MKKIFLTISVLLLVLLGYFLLWPVPISPVAWNAPGWPGYIGPHAVKAASRINYCKYVLEKWCNSILRGMNHAVC